ncbi:SigB/SigF/SigG family RNA polymerase sigma factor [Jannaschia sp. R86511]|uniref:SigB/SigF/SigG family RNA polymerase sigma factor n=1 Tax=Jannaschia sp. R86511 TaxID=3093853 RepID=UPI0036D30874
MTVPITACSPTRTPPDEQGAVRVHRGDPDAGDLFLRLSLARDPRAREELVEELVRLHLPAARSMAARYRDRGVPTEDLMQIAALGLVKAVRGYDCGHGTSFMGYAIPTITGEIKRYFRDSGWVVRPTRRLQELRPRIARATDELSQDLYRAPTINELAGHLGAAVDDVIEAVTSGSGYSAVSLDAPPNGEHSTWANLVPDTDTDLSSAPDRLTLQALLVELPPRERRILALRFFANKTQTEIGVEIGLSQMQVSRLLSGALKRLREGMTADV